MERDVLLKASDICKSDETYGGLFDDILDIDSSMAAKIRDFCLLKYVVDNKFISLRYVNINPHQIDKSRVQCRPIVSQCQDEAEENLLEALKAREYSADAIECLMYEYREEGIFGWNVAKEFLSKIQINEFSKRSEDFRISKVLSDFNKISSNCLFSFNWSLFVF